MAKNNQQNTIPAGKAQVTQAITQEDRDLVASIIAQQQAEQQEQEEIVADFLYCGKPYTYETFAEDFQVKQEYLVTTVDILKQKGKITDIDIVARDKQMAKVLKEAEIIEAGKAVVEDRLQEEAFRLETKRQGVPKYESVEFEFGTKAKLDDFRLAVYNFNLESEVVMTDNGFYILRVFQITESELSKLSTLYKTNKVITAGVRKAEDMTEKAVKVVDYSVKNIASPVARAGFSSGVKIAKTLATGLFRLGAMATTEIIEGTRTAAYEIKNDPNIAVAKAEVIQAKNDICSKANRGTVTTDGIRINR